VTVVIETKLFRLYTQSHLFDLQSFINEAEMLLMHPSSADNSAIGNTPGVIGAQEIYKLTQTYWSNGFCNNYSLWLTVIQE
jgi:hypothetical protein